MGTKTYRQAIREALRGELRRDPAVVLLGEDLAGGLGGSGEADAVGGVMGVTKGLLAEFGRGRILDTPISESAMLGAATGAAMTGLRPVAELMFVDFVGVGFDPILNQAAKLRYTTGGQVRVPLVIRTTYGANGQSAAQHSQSLYSLFTHIPGLKVAVPSCPRDAKGLLTEAIRDDGPVVVFEHKALYDTEGEVADEPFVIPFGEARVVREGSDCTIVALGRMVGFAEQAAEALAADGVESTVLDPRTVSPLDEAAIVESVRTTGRLVVVDESHPRCSVASDIAALVAERAFGELTAPTVRVTAPHSPVPFAASLEELYVPGPRDIEAAVRKALG